MPSPFSASASQARCTAATADTASLSSCTRRLLASKEVRPWVKTPGASSESGERHSSTQGPERARPVARKTFRPALLAALIASAFAAETL